MSTEHPQDSSDDDADPPSQRTGDEEEDDSSDYAEYVSENYQLTEQDRAELQAVCDILNFPRRVLFASSCAAFVPGLCLFFFFLPSFLLWVSSLIPRDNIPEVVV